MSWHKEKALESHKIVCVKARDALASDDANFILLLLMKLTSISSSYLQSSQMFI